MLPRKLFSLTFLSLTIISTFSYCKSSSKVDGKPQKVTVQQPAKTDRCSQTITYHADKLSEHENQVEADVNITINPSAKRIYLQAEIPSAQQKVNFETIIETIDCNLNADLTEGYSIYSGYIVQQNGTSTKVTLRIEAKDGKLKLFNGDPEKNDSVDLTKWSVAQ